MTSVLTRRTVLKTAALASTAIAAPLVRGAFAAGKLSCGFWDHWVPTATAPLEQLCREWAAKEKVDITVDFITSNGDKDLLTMAAEAQAKSGHDVLQFTSWYATGQAENLEPVDDVVGAIIAQNGSPTKAAEYLGKSNGHWIAVPTGYGSTLSPPCARIDLMKQFTGLDVTKMYPAGAPPDQQLADNWTWAFFLDAAEKCFKGGYPFGMPMSTTPDAVNWVGTMFAAHGVQLVDVEGQYHGQVRRHQAGAGVVSKGRAAFPAYGLCVERRLEQQGADFRPKRADHEFAERLGRRQARRAESRRAAVDVPAAEGSQWPV